MTSPISSSTIWWRQSTQESTIAGNPTNTVDNLILRPRYRESVQYYQTYTITWNGTTNGNISAFYNSLLPSLLTNRITTCQNIPNHLGLNQCPWIVLPSALPDVTDAGFEILLVWNNTLEGSQISPEFGVSNTSSLTQSTASTGAPLIISTMSEPSPSITSEPSALAQDEKDISVKIQGVGLGVGISLLILLILGCLYLCRRRIRKLAGTTGGTPQRSSNLPRPATLHTERVRWNPFARNNASAILLADYKYAEHFGLVKKPVKR